MMCASESFLSIYILLTVSNDLALEGPKSIYEAVMAAWAGF